MFTEESRSVCFCHHRQTLAVDKGAHDSSFGLPRALQLLLLWLSFRRIALIQHRPRRYRCHDDVCMVCCTAVTTVRFAVYCCAQQHHREAQSATCLFKVLDTFGTVFKRWNCRVAVTANQDPFPAVFVFGVAKGVKSVRHSPTH